MFKLFYFLIQLLILLTIVVLFVNNSFIISFDIGDYKYSFSSNIFFGIIISTIFLIYILQYLYFKFRFTLHKYKLNSKYNKLEKGYSSFVEAMISIANKDNKKAILSHKKMLSYLKNDPSLSLLLQAEVLKIEKKFDQLNDVYEKMINNKNTETLGYRGLMEQNLKQEDYHHAFIYGEKLFFLNPKIEKLYETLVYIIAKTKNWNQLLLISEKAYTQRIVNREIVDENKSIAYFEIAQIKMYSDYKEALKLIQKGLNLKINFPPYIKLYIQILLNNNQLAEAKKLLKKFWSQKPTSLLRKVIVELISESNLDNLEFIKELVQKNSNHEESKKLMVYFAIRANNWEAARLNIKGLISFKPSREVCIFMSKIEIGESNNIQIADSWKLRAKNAQLDNIWICSISNQLQDEWKSISASGYFNSLEWKQPKMLNQFIESL